MAKTAKTTEAAEPARIYNADVFALKDLIMRFKVNSLAQIKNLNTRLEPLDAAIKEFQEAAEGSQEKANELFYKPSCLTKKDVEFLSEAEFDESVAGLNLPLAQARLVATWLVV